MIKTTVPGEEGTITHITISYEKNDGEKGEVTYDLNDGDSVFVARFTGEEAVVEVEVSTNINPLHLFSLKKWVDEAVKNLSPLDILALLMRASRHSDQAIKKQLN